MIKISETSLSVWKCSRKAAKWKLLIIGNRRTPAYSFTTKAMSIKGYKKSLLETMLNCAFHLSSTWESFKSECDRINFAV